VYSISHTSKILTQGVRFAAIAAILIAVSIGWAVVDVNATATAASAGSTSASAQAKRRSRPVPTATPVALPPDVRIPRYLPGPLPFRDGETLVYETGWAGIPAAEARVSLVQNKEHPQWWTAQMWITSSRAVDVVYRMRDYIREDFGRDSLHPNGIYILQHEKKRRDEWRVRFNRDAHLVTAIRKNSRGRTWTRCFTGGDPWGPFSGAMMALSQPLKVGRFYTFDVFSGGNRYVLAFTVLKRERITTRLGTFDTLRIEPTVVWLSNGSFRNQARQTTLWVTDDERHLPVRIDAAVFIGNIRADLVEITNGPGPSLKAAPTQTTADKQISINHDQETAIDEKQQIDPSARAAEPSGAEASCTQAP
jgi:hypothetical protein